MLAKRIIPCLDVTAGRVVKGINFVELRDAGDPVEIAARYNEQGADELTFLDITATSDERDLILHIIEAVRVAGVHPAHRRRRRAQRRRRAPAPERRRRQGELQLGGGGRPRVIVDASAKYGAQCIVVAIDAKRRAGDVPGWDVYTHGGRRNTGLDAVGLGRRMARRAPARSCLPAWTATAPATASTSSSPRAVADAVPVPVIASGGVWRPAAPLRRHPIGGADAVLAASIFHYGEFSVRDAKAQLARDGIPVRVVRRAAPPLPPARRARCGSSAGSWKRSKLPVADRPGLRPTPDRVRETLVQLARPGPRRLALPRRLSPAAARSVSRRPRAAPAEVVLRRARPGPGGAAVRGEGRLGRRRPHRARRRPAVDGPGGRGRLRTGDARPAVRCAPALPAMAAAARIVTPGGFVYVEAPTAIAGEPVAAAGLEPWRAARAGNVHFHSVSPAAVRLSGRGYTAPEFGGQGGDVTSVTRLTAVYPGTFDPMTLVPRGPDAPGQPAVRAADRRRRRRASQATMFSVGERLQIATELSSPYPNVEVMEFSRSAARLRGRAGRQGGGAGPARGQRLRVRVPDGRHEPAADARRGDGVS
jgi:cyclase